MLGVDLCIAHFKDPQEFADDLLTFTVNGPTGIEVTESVLDDFERKGLTNSKSSRHGTKTAANKSQQNVHFQYDELESDGENDEVMDAYICTTPKVNDIQDSFC